MPKSKSMCVGCRNDYYNRNRKGGCWSFTSAKIVRRVRVGTWELPPYSKDRAEKCLSCFHAQGSAMLDLDDCRVVDDVEATRKRWDEEARVRRNKAEV